MFTISRDVAASGWNGVDEAVQVVEFRVVRVVVVAADSISFWIECTHNGAVETMLFTWQFAVVSGFGVKLGTSLRAPAVSYC